MSFGNRHEECDFFFSHDLQIRIRKGKSIVNSCSLLFSYVG